MWAKVAVVNENWQPMAQATIEAFNLDSPGTPLATAVTDNGGLALFLALPTSRVFFKPRITRAAGAYGDAQQMGKLNIQVIASSDSCIDALVDASGLFGTDTTIQAAITRLASTSGAVSIFVMGGVYTENLSVTSATATYTITGCNPNLSDWPKDTSDTIPNINLSAIVSGVSGNALDYNATKPLVIEGILFINNSNTNPTIRTRGAKLRLKDCWVQNLGTAGAVADTAGPSTLLVDQCFIIGGAGNDAINVATNDTCHIFDSWCLGRVIADGAAGFIISNTTVRVGNATLALSPGGNNGRVDSCYINQSSTGDAISITGVVAPAVGWEITGTQINGAGHATSGRAVKVGADCHVTLTGNIFNGFGIGVDANAASTINGEGNEYQDITTTANGTPTSGLSLDGIWRDQAYNAGDYACNNGGTWTVQVGDVNDNHYMIQGRTITWAWRGSLTSVTAPLPTVLSITMPAGKSIIAGQNVTVPCILFDNGVPAMGIATVIAGGSLLAISRLDGAAFTASVNNTGVLVEITFEFT